MNIEDYRDYCLSLGSDVEEKLPFTMFKSGENVLVFYVCGHMFAFFDCADYSVVTLKCGNWIGAGRGLVFFLLEPPLEFFLCLGGQEQGREGIE